MESQGQLLASSYVCLQGAAVRTGRSPRVSAAAVSRTEPAHVLSAEPIFQGSIDSALSDL